MYGPTQGETWTMIAIVAILGFAVGEGACFLWRHIHVGMQWR